MTFNHKYAKLCATFTKIDLRTGDVILRRDGSVEIFVRAVDRFIGQSSVGGSFLANIDLDLTSDIDTSRDIMAVRRPQSDYDCQFDAFEHNRGTLVYNRDEVEELTLAEVCKLLGKNIKIIQ